MNSLYTCKAFAVIVVSVCLFGVVNAQVTNRDSQRWIRASSPNCISNSGPVVAAIPIKTSAEPELKATYYPLVPVAPRAPKFVEQVQDNGVGTLIGTTYYDFQTNASMSNRITYFADGSDKYIQLLWMANADSTRDAATRTPGFNPNRGSHYNFINVSDPDNLEAGITNWKKIEPDRAGWPSAVQFDDGTLGTPSHTPVKFWRNGGLTDDNWQKSATDPTTAADSAVWARAAVDGNNNVHLIYNRTFPPAVGSTTAINQVCYRRSTSAGDTWEAEIRFTGPTQPATADRLSDGEGGDTYAIAARNEHVSIVLYSNFRMILWQSHDYGATWSRRRGASFAAIGTPIDTTMEDDTTVIRTDTTMGPLNSMDVVIDHDGVTHWVAAYCPQFFEQRTPFGGTAQNTIFLLNGTGLNGVGSNRIELQNTGLAYGNSFDTNYVYRMGPVGGGSWDGVGHVVNMRLFDGGSRWPQLGVDDNNAVYCLYGSMKSGDLKSVTVDTTGGGATEADTLVTLDGLQMHVYGVKVYKPAGGYNIPDILWSSPKDLSPMGVNSQYATLCDDVKDGRLYYAYSSTASPGDRVTNVEMPAELASVYARAIPTTDLNEPVVSVTDEHTLQADVALAPNPSDEASRITISGVTNGTILVSLASSLGEIVMQTSTQPFGERAEILIPTRSLVSGAYTVTIQQNGRRITKTLSVIH